MEKSWKILTCIYLTRLCFFTNNDTSIYRELCGPALVSDYRYKHHPALAVPKRTSGPLLVKLEWVAPLMTEFQPLFLIFFICSFKTYKKKVFLYKYIKIYKKKYDKKQIIFFVLLSVTCHTWHVTRDMCHVICDTRHVTHDTWGIEDSL